MGEHLLVSDIHARRRPPSRCTATYWADLLELLKQTNVLARLRNAVTVTWAGDVFDHNAPSRTGHGLVQDLQRVIALYPGPLFGVAGNHERQYDTIDSVTTTQPLGVLLRMHRVFELNGWHRDHQAPVAQLYGVPWLQHWSEEAIRDALAGWREPVMPLQPALVVTHAPIYPPGDEPRYEGAEYTPADWWAEAMGHEGFLFYGHIHEPHGVWRHGGVTFCNNGALSRGSLEEHNLEREVGVTWWDDETGDFDFMPLDARPASEVFLVEQAAGQAAAQDRLDAFLASFNEVRLPRLSVEGVIAHIRTQGLSAEVIELAEELLTAAAHEGRKP